MHKYKIIKQPNNSIYLYINDTLERHANLIYIVDWDGLSNENITHLQSLLNQWHDKPNDCNIFFNQIDDYIVCITINLINSSYLDTLEQLKTYITLNGFTCNYSYFFNSA